MEPVKQLWLQKLVTVNHRGNFELAGDCGRERIVVEIDPTVIANLRPNEAESAVLAMHSRIQAAAGRKYRAREAYPVFHSYSTRLRHNLIALTDQDIAPA